MPHDHTAHDHAPHPHRIDQDAALTYWQAMEIAIREILQEKGIASAAEIATAVDAMDARTPSNGAAVVAKAWSDPEFAALLFSDANAACAQMGFDLGALNLIALKNTATVHNVVVCTLCSCYPRNLLGLPPDWYKQRAYRARVVQNPRGVLSEFGLNLPDDVTLRVHDSTADMRYIVVPHRPADTQDWAEDKLASIVTRDCMIGVAVPDPASAN